LRPTMAKVSIAPWWRNEISSPTLMKSTESRCHALMAASLGPMDLDRSLGPMIYRRPSQTSVLALTLNEHLLSR
jgi:hypothetical protein